MNVARIFWTLFTFEAVVFAIYMVWALRDPHLAGTVGGWLVYVVPPFMLAVPLAVVLIGRSRGAMIAGIYCLSIPLLQFVFGPVYGIVDDYVTERRIAGDLTFLRPSQRNLAHAIRAHDVTQARALIPAAGDLNASLWGDSLFKFAMMNSDSSNESAEIIKAMIEAGADPGRLRGGKVWALLVAMSSPAMTRVMLDAGANPNGLEETGRPVWWNALCHGADKGIETLKLLLERGADVKLRDGDLGPVGWAASLKNWRGVWILIEHGAAWKDERAFGQPISDELQWDFDSRRGSRLEIPDEMLKLRDLFGQH